MDLYEALKNGKSEDELKESFNRQLAIARARLTQEKEASTRKEKAKKEFLNAAASYFKECGYTPNKDISELENASKLFKNVFGFNLFPTEETDDDIILSFVKTL